VVGTSAVRIPMMPKGVEHFGRKEMEVTKDSVRIPMMPKGVEHKIRKK
jgi:hypothetical protein